METNKSKRIKWAGDFSNAPQVGTVVSDCDGWMTIQWDSGKTARIPAALATGPRWTVLA